MKSLVRVQFRKDWDQHKLFFLAWWILLVVQACVDAQSTEFLPDSRGYLRSTYQDFLAPLVNFVMYFVPGLVGLSDTPSRQDGFYRTRPVPLFELWMGKAVVLGVCVVLPYLLHDVLFNLLMHLGPLHVARSLVDRVVFILPTVTLAVCLGGLVRHVAGLVMLTMGLWIGFVLFNNVAAWVIRLTLGPVAFAVNLQAEYNDTVMCASALVLAAFALAALWKQLHGPASWIRCTLILSCALPPAFLAAGVTEERLRRYDQNLARGGELAWEGVSARIAVGSPTVTSRAGDKTDSRQILIRPTVDILGLPVDHLARADTCRITLAGAGDFRKKSGSVRTSREGQPGLQIARKLGARILLGSEEGGSISFSIVSSPHELSPYANRPIQVSCGLNLDIWRVDPVFDMPYRNLEEAQVGNTRFRLFVPPVDDADFNHNNPFILQARVPKFFLNLRRDERHLESVGEFGLYYVLYNPKQAVGVLFGGRGASTTRARSTSFPEIRLFEGVLNSDVQRTWLLDDEWLQDARLYLFRRRHIGWMEVETPANNLELAAWYHHPWQLPEPQERVSWKEFVNAFRKIVPGDDNRESKVRELEELMVLLSRYAITDAERNPVVRRITEIGLSDPTVLFEMLDRVNGRGKYALLQAIDRFPPAQIKPLVLNALMRNHQLTDVVIRNGWEIEAKGDLRTILRSGRPVMNNVVAGLALARDPADHGLLVESFKRRPSVELYNSLNSLPRLRNSLDRVVADLWGPPVILDSNHFVHDPRFALALRTGDPTALALAHRYLKSTHPFARHHESELVELMRTVMILPPHNKDALATIVSRKPGDLVFNHDSGLYEIRPDPGAGEGES
jgi:hypothetical protein